MGESKRREGRETTRPSRKDVTDRVLPALARTLGATDNKDIVTACMVAMAKIGERNGAIRFRELFQPRLSSKVQEVRETAALAMGIARLADAGPAPA